MGWLKTILGLLPSLLSLFNKVWDRWIAGSSSRKGDKAASDVAKDREKLKNDPNKRPPASPLMLFLPILFLSAHCDDLQIPTTERRIHCESEMLRANKPVNDIALCPDGNGHSCFSQTDMATLIGQCKKWQKELYECQRNCNKGFNKSK